ncbi:MAG TPA: mevalonate kinase [Oligoflexia bacterium]|nr:mevalonate kinase [Oligoflexia bacterium]
MKVVGRSHGKFILLGEHFVVHGGVAALAFPMKDLTCEVTIVPDTVPMYRAEVPNTPERDIVENVMARAVYIAADCFRVDIKGQPIRVESKTNFPVSRGFGSSAAFAVALARAFDEYRTEVAKVRADWMEIERAVSAIETLFHGNPSGVDAATILAGRPIRYENRAVVREVQNKALDFVAIDSGLRENSAPLIARITEFKHKNLDRWTEMTNELKTAIDNAEQGLNYGDAAVVVESIRKSQGILSELGLSNETIDALIYEACANGALAGKVSGAGGGGAVILAAPRTKGRELAARMTERGYSVLGIEHGESA